MSDFIPTLTTAIISVLLSNYIKKSRDSFVVNNSLFYKIQNNLTFILKSFIFVIIGTAINYYIAIYITSKQSIITNIRTIFMLEILLIFLIFSIGVKNIDKNKNKKKIIALLYIMIFSYYGLMINGINSVDQSREIVSIFYLIFTIYIYFIFIISLLNTISTYKERHTIHTKSGKTISSSNIKQAGNFIIIEVDEEYYYNHYKEKYNNLHEQENQELEDEKKDKVKTKYFITINENNVENIQSITMEPISEGESIE